MESRFYYRKDKLRGWVKELKVMVMEKESLNPVKMVCVGKRNYRANKK